MIGTSLGPYRITGALGADGLLTGVSVAAGKPPSNGKPFPLFHAPSANPLDFDVDASGERFLFSLPVDPRPGAVIAVALGWRAAIGDNESARSS